MSITEGDQVIIYSSRQQIDSIIVKRGSDLNSRYGHFVHNDMIGQPFGSKLASSNGRGFVYLLKPTPELWTLALPHRTQILYLPDIAFITSYLDIKVGSSVIEAGTGSGSFTHSIARSVGASGKVHSFEYHEERYEKALAEFEEHGLSQTVTLKHQNVYKDGFELDAEVDAVFLDLPAPWEALSHAKMAMRKDRQSRICCFSPCIEQVLKTVSALSDQGFSDITMYEALTRSHEPTIFTAPSVTEAIDRIQGVEAKKEHRRMMQISDALNKKNLKRKLDDSEDLDSAPETANRIGDTTSEQKKTVTNSGDGVDTKLNRATREDTLVSIDPKSDSSASRQNNSRSFSAKIVVDAPREYTFKPGALTRGHTSYLTFATLLPELGRVEANQSADLELEGEQASELLRPSE